jgi:amino acid transporter
LGTEEKKFFVREATGLTKEISGKSAMIGNIHAMGVTYFFVFAFFALLIYPGVNLPLTVLVTLVPGVIIAAMYYLFTLSMPRTGGDYIWVSRIIHPSIGFMTNFFITFTFLTSISVGASWGIIYGLFPHDRCFGDCGKQPGPRDSRHYHW